MSDPGASSQRRGQILIAVAIVLLGFNLRPAAVSIAPVLAEIRTDLGMSAIAAGLLTTLPVLCFALFGAFAPWLARRVGEHRTILGALLLVVLGLAVRPTLDSPWPFIAASIPALAGMAMANVLLPSLVKLHFPNRVGLMTSVYTTALAIGLTSTPISTVPISNALGTWRDGLAVWAATAAVAAIPWLVLIRHDVRPELRPRSIRAGQVARSPLAWAMAALFGLQSLQAYAAFGWLPQVYRDAGFSASTAGLLLGLATGTAIPISFLLPSFAARRHNQASITSTLTGCYAIGYGGLILWPTHVPWMWALFIGIGTGIFPLVLTMIGLRSRTPEGTAALSGFTQSVGYLLAAIGPFSVGVLYDWTGGWTAPLILLIALLVPQMIAGWLASKPRFIEDELPLGLARPSA